MKNKAFWIGYITDKEYDFTNKKQKYGIPPVYIKRDICVKKPVAKASIEVSALGVYTVFVNEEEISDDFMAPGWTEYAKRVEFFKYDITQNIKKGTNLLSFIVADGWFASNLSDVGKNNFGEYPLKLWYKLTIKYVDGTSSKYCSDGTELATKSNIIYCDNQNGIKIDNRIDFSNGVFEKVEVFDLPQPKKAFVSKVVEQERFKGRIISKNDGKAMTFRKG